MILVIDANNLGHRVFHTPQGALSTKQGEPSGVMLGILNAIRGMLEKFPETTRVIMCWDAKGGTNWRKELYPDYKGNRDYGKEDEEKKKSYEGLWAQLDESHKMLHMVGIHSIKVPGYEADDLMASIAFTASKQDKNKQHIMIVTSDKDMLQLISENVSVYSPYKDKVISPLNFYEETGVTLESYLGYRALVGDTSDNIIGIKGIGEKTAKSLMDEFGHIDNVLNATGDAKKKLMKSKIKCRIFEPDGLRRLGINNKIMNLKFVPYSVDVEDAINAALGIHFSMAPKGEDVGLEIEVDNKAFKAWLMRWQFVSILANYMPWITPFLALGDDE